LRSAIAEIADLAAAGRESLLAGDHDRLRELVDRNFELRRRLYPLDPRHARMVELARSLGASANYAGSGGAIVGVPGDRFDWARARSSFDREGCALFVPSVR
jgi:glucuronokinase